MLAESLSNGDTYASAQGLESKALRREPDSYVPVGAAGGTSLVLPGPTMQLRSQILVGGRCYALKELFVIEFEFGDGEVFATHRTLPVHGNGSTQQEALESFCSSFDFQWRHLVESPPENLTRGGRKRRELMLEAVANVMSLRD